MRLIADLGRIRQVSGRLGGVEREFSDATQFTGDDAAFLGSADLAAALDSCVNGWSQQRAALISQLSNVARLSARIPVELWSELKREKLLDPGAPTPN